MGVKIEIIDQDRFQTELVTPRRVCPEVGQPVEKVDCSKCNRYVGFMERAGEKLALCANAH